MTAPHPLSYFDNLQPFSGRLWGKTFKNHSWRRESNPPALLAIPGAQDTCPACGGELDYIGPRNPLRFACPLCSFWSDDPEVPSRPTWLTWRTVGFEEHQIRGEPLCARCKSPMVERKGKYGTFLGCSAYAKTKCKGKPTYPRIVITQTKVELALWVESERYVGGRGMGTRTVLEILKK